MEWKCYADTVVEMKKTFQKQMLAAQEEKKQLQEKLKEESTRLLSLLKGVHAPKIPTSLTFHLGVLVCQFPG